MAGKTYVTKGYSTYTDIPARQGGFDHGPKSPINQYAVETKTIERVRAPAASFKEFVGSPSKAELLKEYVHLPSMSSRSLKYAPTNHYEGSEPNYGLNYESSNPPKDQLQNALIPKEHNFTSPAHGYSSEESNRIHSGQGLVGVSHIRTGKISGPNGSWQSAGPPATHHPLTNPTNNINEALGYLEESVYYSPRADPWRRGVLDDPSTRAQPLEPQSRYARPAFVAKLNDTRHKFTNTGSGMDSYEATTRYRGSLVP